MRVVTTDALHPHLAAVLAYLLRLGDELSFLLTLRTRLHRIHIFRKVESACHGVLFVFFRLAELSLRQTDSLWLASCRATGCANHAGSVGEGSSGDTRAARCHHRHSYQPVEERFLFDYLLRDHAQYARRETAARRTSTGSAMEARHNKQNAGNR